MFAVLGVIALCAAALPAHAAVSHASHVTHFAMSGLPLVGLMFNELAPAPDIPALDAYRKPIAGGYDVYRDTLYSTIQFPLAGQPVGTPLRFFQGAESAPSDLTLTNVPQGTIPGGQKFYAKRVYIIPLVELGFVDDVVDAAQIVRDVDRILVTNRGQFTITQTNINRTRGPFFLDACGQVGGVMPDWGGTVAPAAAHGAVYAHVRTQITGGWPIDLAIYETETFPLNMTWGVQNAITANLLIQVRLDGYRYVKNG